MRPLSLSDRKRRSVPVSTAGVTFSTPSMPILRRMPPATSPTPVTRAAVSRIGTLTGALENRPLPAARTISNPVSSKAARSAVRR
jgi:hypothetical protein